MPSPSSDLVALQERQQRLLGLLVALSPYEGHDLGALLSGPDICHTTKYSTENSYALMESLRVVIARAAWLATAGSV
jgi:hypothetical protein